MRLECLHGYFMFMETRAAQVSNFMALSGFDLVLKDGYWTFSALEDAPEFAIIGSTYLGAPCIKTFEGKPWDVMRENKLVFDFVKQKVVPMLTVVQLVEFDSSVNYLTSPGMILPGSLTEEASRVTDYSAHFEGNIFKYSEVIFE